MTLPVANVELGQLSMFNQGQKEGMLLKSYDQLKDELLFINTYFPRTVLIRRTDPYAPEELYFVHIKVKDMDNLPGLEEREAIMRNNQGING